MRLRFTLLAQQDIQQIYDRISAEDRLAAQRVEDLIRQKCERLAVFPRIGSRTDMDDVRRLPLVRWPYTIFYQIVVVDGAIDILRVVAGARVRDIDKLPD